MKDISTKDRILEAALTVFSEKGYDGVGVDFIAETAGMKGPSLYKHFKSKRAIFDTIVAKVGEKMKELSENVGLPTEENLDEVVTYYGKLSEKQLQELSKKIFLFYLEDDFMSRFWRMANMEQYQNSEISEIFRKIYMEDSIVYQSKLFEEMIKQGYFLASSPEVIAMNFYTPIFFLLSKYNNRPGEREEALLILKHQVSEFYRIYRKKDET